MKKLLFIAAILVAAVASAQPKDALFGVKSGIVTMSMDMMGMEIVQDIYFDDYGQKQVTVANFNGQKNRIITENGSQIMINDEAKTAQRMPSFGPQERINFLNLTDAVKKQNKIKELGTETIAGKECKKYSVTITAMGQTQGQTVWVYKGITLKSVTESMMGSMEQTATKIQENVTIEPSMFEIPAGVKVEDMDMSMMGGF